MRTTLRWTLSVGLVLASGLTGIGQTAAAAASETSPAVTIYVRNYAGVPSKTLTEAEEVATGIFRNAGIETRWVELAVTLENNQRNSTNHPAYLLSDIHLDILPCTMSDHLGLPKNVMGLAPGTGRDRDIVYVFDGNVEALFQDLLWRTRNDGSLDRNVLKAQILGHVFAHELGHVLLNLQVHTAHGIMQGQWSPKDLVDAVHGRILFSPQQSEILRAEVGRRNKPQETLRVSARESEAAAR
jgi:hypothetical protein